jgi:hypothetical protein
VAVALTLTQKCTSGYCRIQNIDFSETVISQMKERCKDMLGMTWEVMDVMNMSEIRSRSVDVAIDKGTLDALMCESDGDVWNPSPKIVDDVGMEVDEVCRVLSDGGMFLYFTFGQPHFRRRHLTRPAWDLRVETLGDSFHYFLYIADKASKTFQQ